MGLALLLQHVDKIPHVLITLFIANEDHIISLHNNEIREANGGYELVRAIDDEVGGALSDVVSDDYIAPGVSRV